MKNKTNQKTNTNFGGNQCFGKKKLTEMVMHILTLFLEKQ